MGLGLTQGYCRDDDVGGGSAQGKNTRRRRSLIEEHQSLPLVHHVFLSRASDLGSRDVGATTLLDEGPVIDLSLRMSPREVTDQVRAS
jgi:hypothetical protein